MKKTITLIAICLLCMLGVTAAGAEGAPTSSLPEITSAQAQTGKMYGIGSVSKVFTAAAVMKLVDEGKIDLDEPLTTYIPGFVMADARYRLITPRMLINHSSGLMGMTGINGFLAGDSDTYLHDNFLEFLKPQYLKHDPGDRSIYSNDSFTLAEILVESVSCMSFTDYIARSFAEPLGLGNIKTPQSDFDWDKLACTYLGNSELLPQTLGMIGSGGIYSTMEDLCRFATIFMDSSDGSVLSRSSVDEMAKAQHQMVTIPSDSDTIFRYGLGWDCVDLYPFNRLGIQALSKGGATNGYLTNLTVLPEYNLAAAVASSGAGGMESLVAQEIILAVLEEEGLIPEGAAVVLPEQNLERATVPESMKSYAGIYAAGTWGQYDARFTEDSLILTPIGVRNERPMEFLYNTDGGFVSASGDYIGYYSSISGAVGTTRFTFEGDYLLLQSYESVPGLGNTAIAMPFAEKVVGNPVSGDAWNAWTARNGKEYLLVSEKYSSELYIDSAIAKTLADERVYGYVSQGIYETVGVSFPAAAVVDENTALGFQNTPTMTGRDIVDLSIEETNGVEYLRLNNNRYVDAAAAVPFSGLGETVVIGDEPVWVDVDSGLGGRIVSVTKPENGSWFVYGDKMNCIATSLEKDLRGTIILPEGGRLLLAGEPGAGFIVR